MGLSFGGSMERIIVFRYHRDSLLCKNRLRLLKKYNPDTKVYGLYGGDEKKFQKYERNLKPYLEDNFCIQDKKQEWKWMNGDLALAQWYRHVGKNIPFSGVVLYEWDILLFDSIDNIYKNIPEESNGVTMLTPLSVMEKDWQWVIKSEKKEEWLKLLKIAHSEFAYNQEPYGGWFAGAYLSRNFLEKYSIMDVPEICHDELRLPLFSQILGIPLYNTRFTKDWTERNEDLLFNCDKNDISMTLIKEQLGLADGKRIFHPYSKAVYFDLSSFLQYLIWSSWKFVDSRIKRVKIKTKELLAKHRV